MLSKLLPTVISTMYFEFNIYQNMAFLTELNFVPPAGANPLCKWSWVSNPNVYPSGTTDLTVSDVYIPLFHLANFEIDFTYQHVLSAAAPESGLISGSSSGNNAVVSPCMEHI